MGHHNVNSSTVNSNNTYNIFVNSGNNNLGSLLPTALPPETSSLFGPGSTLSQFVSGFEAGFANGLGYGVGQAVGQATAQALTGQSCPCSAPSPVDSSHPAGSLQVGQDGVITTPGGYKIQATGQYEWNVTGPDGKSSKIWGDPHVAESDGGKWDFKRNSSFVLGDGTRINVSTKPYNNMTVTSGLEIISGNDRVQVSDVDQGKGKVGEVTHDGFAHANSFGNNDVFVMGQNAADWSFQGKEIVGSENGGESFKLGKDLRPLVDTTTKYGGPQGYADSLTKDIMSMMSNLMQTLGNLGGGTSPVLPQNTAQGNQAWDQGYNQNTHKNALSDTIKLFGQMLEVISQVLALAGQVRRPATTNV